jgi:hypothetical protein
LTESATLTWRSAHRRGYARAISFSR